MIMQNLHILQCGDCKHWHKLPSDPNNLGAKPAGECRESLHVILVPAGQGMAPAALYAVINDNFPACSHHRKRD